MYQKIVSVAQYCNVFHLHGHYSPPVCYWMKKYVFDNEYELLFQI